MSQFIATKAPIPGRGAPPDSFLSAIVAWALTAPDEVFAPNAVRLDIYGSVKPELGPWMSLIHRKAAMCEVMRVHAGMESSWNWSEGVNKTNRRSQANIEGEECGPFQVSFDSTRLGDNAMRPFAIERGINSPFSFIQDMKSNRTLALDYYARLIRVNIAWAGPLIRGEIHPFLSRAAVAEFQSMLSTGAHTA